MSRITKYVAVCLVAFLFCGALPALADEGALSDDERAYLVELLEDSRSELESLAAQADDASWHVRTDPERWSVGEVVEHLLLSEEGFYSMITQALAGEENPEWQAMAAGGVEGIVGMMKDRSQKFQAPDNLVPSGKLSREESLARYATARAKMLDLVRSTDAPIKKFAAQGPAGTMNVQQWLVLCGTHNLRHNQQIQEVLDSLSKEG